MSAKETRRWNFGDLGRTNVRQRALQHVPALSWIGARGAVRRSSEATLRVRTEVSHPTRFEARERRGMALAKSGHVDAVHLAVGRVSEETA